MVGLISWWAVAVGTAVGVGTPPSGPDDSEPLEVVAVDVSDFPRVVIDVALPEWELPGDVTADAFEMPGATGVVAEALLASDLTVALVLDDGPGVPVESIATQQGAVTELVRNIPDGVELLTATTSGVIVGPTADRAATLGAVGALGTTPAPAGSTVATSAIRAGAVLETTSDARRQLVMITSAGAEITPDEQQQLMASLDRSTSALRVLSVGGNVGPRLSSVADATGGFAVDVGTGPVAALHAVDVLTITFSDQYRVTATIAEPGDQLVRLTMAGRRYEMVVPDLGASLVPPTTTSTSTSTTSTTTTSPPTSTLAAAAAQGPPSAAEPTSSGRDDRAPSVLAGAQAVVAVAAIGAVIVAWRKRRSGHRTVRKNARTSSTKIAGRSKAAK